MHPMRKKRQLFMVEMAVDYFKAKGETENLKTVMST